jgi:hypothetical protein
MPPTNEELASLVRDHDRWLWAAKGACTLALLFMGLVVYVFNDVRAELRRKIDADIIEQHMLKIDRHLEYLDSRFDQLRNMIPNERRGGQ